MHLKIVIFLNILLFGVIESNPIIGGYPAGQIVGPKSVLGREQYSYVVYLKIFEILNIHGDLGILMCGGAIIRDNVILTAGHCLTWTILEPKVSVYAGILDQNIEKFGKTHRYMQDYKIHKDYIYQTVPAIINGERIFQHNDIALIWINEKYAFNEKINFIPLMSSNVNIDNQIASIIGWGRNSLSNETSPMLYKGETRVRSVEFCRESYIGLNIHSKMSCAISDMRTTTSCSGDSGGPVIINNRLAGIISFSAKVNTLLRNGTFYVVCTPNLPMLFTNVAKYTNWINKNIRDGSPGDRKPFQGNQPRCLNV